MAANRLLVLDDDPGVLHCLAEIGREVRYDVMLIGSGGELHDVYDAFDPSVLVLGLNPDGDDAIEILSFLRRHGCRAPIVLLSGGDERALEAVRRVGVSLGLEIIGVMAKPPPPGSIAPLLLEHRQLELTEWADELRRGIEGAEIDVYYQPKVNTVDGRLVGFEALARWFHPTRGPIEPNHFIPLAEAAGLISPLTDLVLRHAITCCAEWAAAGHDLSVAVNLSAPVLARDDLMDKLLRLVAQHQVPAHCITLEVTESIAVHSPLLVMETISRLRLHRFNVALDDFGMGYSNLAALDRLPINELKIDRSVIATIPGSRNGRIIVRAIAALAQQLGLVAVAEGVEHLDACRWLGSIGIEQVQGFAIAGPMPSTELARWIETRSYLPLR